MNKKIIEIKKIVSNPKFRKGVEKYCEVLELYKKSKNISKDRYFQRKFNGFFRVRKNKEWQENFYNFFEKNRRNKNLKLEDILKYFYKKTGRKDVSFSSKLLHLINLKMPIYDSVVCKNLDLKNNPSNLDECFEKYNKIIKWYKDFLQSEESKKWVNEFDQVFPEFKKKISNVKKIDFILWQMR